MKQLPKFLYRDCVVSVQQKDKGVKNVYSHEEIKNDLLVQYGWTEITQIRTLGTRGTVLEFHCEEGSFIVKCKETRRLSERESRIEDCLAKAGLPFPTCRLTKQGTRYFLKEGKPYGVYENVVGSTYATKGVMDEKEARNLGQALALLHIALLVLELEETKKNVLEDLEYAHMHLRSGFCSSFSKERFEHFQWIHRDFHRENLLFLEDRVSAYLDFDLLCFGPRVFDLAYCATSELNRVFLQEEERKNYLPFLVSLVTAYHRKNPLTAQELTTLGDMMLLIQELFVFWCEKTNSKEEAKKNRAIGEWLLDVSEKNPLESLLPKR